MAATNQRNKSGGRGSQRRSDSKRTQATHEEGTMHAVKEQVSGYVSRGATHVREMTTDHEGTAVLVALAAGFGLGLLIGAAVSSGRQEPRRWSDRLAAEGIGRRLLERVEGMIPDALAERLGR